VPHGPHHIVLLGDVQDEGIDWQQITRTHLGRARPEDFITPGDIVYP